MSDDKRGAQSNLEAEALRYAAHTLNETGESWTRDAALLLEQIAQEKDGENA